MVVTLVASDILSISRHLPVAHLAFHSGVQVFAVRPGDAGQDFVHANPRNRLARF